jgi:transposase
MSRQGSNYPSELRERAVRMVSEVRGDYPSQWAAIGAVASKLGIGSTETLRKWVRRAEVDAGQRPGLTSEEHAEIKKLRREVAELRRANEILKAGGCCTNWLVLVSVSRVGAGLRPGRSRGGVQLRGWRSRAVDADAGVGGGLVA